MILVFDTETTGLPVSWSAPVSDLNNWPRVVQLAYALYKQDGTMIKEYNHIIKPDGFIIPKSSSEIHGITHEYALSEGKSMILVLDDFLRAYSKSRILVAHNLQYDFNVMASEMIRYGIRSDKKVDLKICTKNEATGFCAIPNPNRWGGEYKWPKLEELHIKLFKETFANQHNALGDVRATGRCFFELVRLGVIDVSSVYNPI